MRVETGIVKNMTTVASSTINDTRYGNACTSMKMSYLVAKICD